VLDETIRFDELLEVLAGDKVVFATVLLACARAAGRVRDAEAEAVWVLGEEALEEGGFAGARRAGDYDWAVLEVCLSVILLVRVCVIWLLLFMFIPVGAIVASWRWVWKGVKFFLAKRRRVEFERAEEAVRLVKTFVKQ